MTTLVKNLKYCQVDNVNNRDFGQKLHFGSKLKIVQPKIKISVQIEIFSQKFDYFKLLPKPWVGAFATRVTGVQLFWLTNGGARKTLIQNNSLCVMFQNGCDHWRSQLQAEL